LALQRLLVESLPWEQPQVRVYGRCHPVPRLTCWVADPGHGYRYSGLDQAITAWSAPLLALRLQLRQLLGVDFNSLLLNRYRNGMDAMGWHSDDEPELDPAAPIASLSLGASRTLRFRPHPRRGPCGLSPLDLELVSGDLLLMDPPSQHFWQHALPVRRRVGSERLNLTFRVVRPRAPRGR
jgi:alkylated DNA repair dioxygenase AlkB